MQECSAQKQILVIFILLLCLCLTGCGASKESYEPLKEGDVYRDFTGELADGGSFTLSDHEGKIILLNFWATWCGPCVGEMPAFPQLIEKYGDSLALVAVDSGEKTKTVTDFLDNRGYTFPVVLDTDGSISNMYPTDGIPYTLIIDTDGRIAYINLGAWDADRMFEEYSKMIDSLLQ